MSLQVDVMNGDAWTYTENRMETSGQEAEKV